MTSREVICESENNNSESKKMGFGILTAAGKNVLWLSIGGLRIVHHSAPANSMSRV